MTLLKKILSLVIAICITVISFAQKQVVPIYFQHVANNDELQKIENKYERFKQQNLGHFSCADETYLPANERNQEFIVIPIFQKTKVSEFWIYIEYFSNTFPDKPIEQRLQRYVRINRDTMRAETYHFKEPEKYINEWKKATPFENVTSQDFFHETGCDAYIVEDIDNANTRKISPMEIGCPLNNLLGTIRYSAAYFTINDAGYRMCINFLDANKQVVKPCHEGGIFFKRLDYRDKNYTALAPLIKKKPMVIPSK